MSYKCVYTVFFERPKCKSFNLESLDKCIIIININIVIHYQDIRFYCMALMEHQKSSLSFHVKKIYTSYQINCYFVSMQQFNFVRGNIQSF